LIVAPLDVTFVRNLYEIRAMLDGLAAAKAAEKNAKRARSEGPSIISLGREAVASGALERLQARERAINEDTERRRTRRILR
jgi:DNA-binding GntR family transcriptional regulator